MTVRTWLGLGLALWIGCAPAPREARRWVILGQGNQARVDPGARIQSAGQHRNLGRGPTRWPLQLVSQGLTAAGAPAVSWDSEKVVFVGREKEGESLGLFTFDLDELRLERVRVGNRECGSAAFLPDGRIVFSARTEAARPIAELESAWALFVWEPIRGDVERITFGFSEIDPTVLGDGRILYSQWQDGRVTAAPLKVLSRSLPSIPTAPG